MRAFLAIIYLFLTSSLLGYYKFCSYQQPEYFLSYLSRAPFDVALADYSFIDKTGLVKSYVRLTPRDKRKLQQVLLKFDQNTSITHELIKKMNFSVRSRKNFIGLVLQDFHLMQPEATVRTVFSTLGLDALKKIHR